MEPPWEGETKICSRHPGHMTKMAATSIYGKNLSKTFSGTGEPISTKLGMYYRGLLLIMITLECLDLFYGKVKFGNLGFSMEKKVKTVDFSEIIAACDLKVGKCRQIIDFIKVCEY